MTEKEYGRFFFKVSFHVPWYVTNVIYRQRTLKFLEYYQKNENDYKNSYRILRKQIISEP